MIQKNTKGDFEKMEGAIILVIFLVIILLVLIISIPIISVKNAKRKKNNKKRLKEIGCIVEASMKHFNGLPIPEGSPCTFQVYEDYYKTMANGAEFKLDRSKVIDVCIKTDVEIQKQQVSSIGGAVGGAVLFGPVGAMIGGRAKTKETRTTTTYLIVTYMNDNEMKYIAYELYLVNGDIRKIVDDFKAKKSSTTTIEL